MWLRPEGRLFPVLVLAVPPDEYQISEACGPAADDCYLGGYVARCVFGSEGLRPDNVADAVANEVQCSDGRFLGVAGDVAGDERQEGNESCGT